MWSSETAEPAPRPPEGVSPGPREAPRRQALASGEARRQRKGIKGIKLRGRPRGQAARRRGGETRLRHRAGPAARYLSGRVLPQAVLGRQVETGAATQSEGSTQEQAATTTAAANPRRSAVGSARGPQPPRGQQQSRPPGPAGSRHLAGTARRGGGLRAAAPRRLPAHKMAGAALR